MLLTNNKPIPTFSIRHFPMNVASKMLRSNEIFVDGNIELSETTRSFLPAVEKICELFEQVKGTSIDNMLYKIEDGETKRWSNGICCSLIIPVEKITFDKERFIAKLETVFAVNQHLNEMCDSIIVYVDNKLIFNMRREDYHFEVDNILMKVDVENLPKLIGYFFDCLVLKQK